MSNFFKMMNKEIFGLKTSNNLRFVNLTFSMFFLEKLSIRKKCHSSFHIFTLPLKRKGYLCKNIRRTLIFVEIKPKIDKGQIFKIKFSKDLLIESRINDIIVWLLKSLFGSSNGS